MANHKKFRGTPKVGRDRPVDLPYPAQLGRGHLAAGSPLAHVAQLRRSPNFRRSSKLLVVCHPGRPETALNSSCISGGLALCHI